MINYGAMFRLCLSECPSISSQGYVSYLIKISLELLSKFIYLKESFTLMFAYLVINTWMESIIAKISLKPLFSAIDESCRSVATNTLSILCLLTNSFE